MTDNTALAVVDILAYRSTFYDLLRRVFLWEFPLELFAELVTTAKEGQGENNPACPYEAALQSFLRTVPAEDTASIYREMKIEYTRLFIGPRHLPAPPYESVYRTPQKLMMQAPTIDVRTFYLRHGFQVTRLNQEPDDTIGVELEFMCALSAAALQAFSGRDRQKVIQLLSAQLEFCNLHLCRWVPQFCADIAGSTTSEFWRAVAACTRAFLEHDVSELENLKAEFSEASKVTPTGSIAG